MGWADVPALKKKIGSDLAQLCGLGLYWPSYKVGLSPAAWAGLMFQPDRTKGLVIAR
jgi:hypothetical protein